MFRVSTSSQNLLKWSGKFFAPYGNLSSSVVLSRGVMIKFSISGGENQERFKSFSSSWDKDSKVSSSSKRKQDGGRLDRSKYVDQLGEGKGVSSGYSKPAPAERWTDRKKSAVKEDKTTSKPSSFESRKPVERRSSFRDSRRDDWGEEALAPPRRSSRYSEYEDAKPASNKFREESGRRASFSGESRKDFKSSSKFEEKNNRFERKPTFRENRDENNRFERNPSFREERSRDESRVERKPREDRYENRFERKPSFRTEREDRDKFRGGYKFGRTRSPSKPRSDDDKIFKTSFRPARGERTKREFDDAPKKRSFEENAPRMEKSRFPRGSISESKKFSQSKDFSKESQSSKSKRRSEIEQDIDEWEEFQDQKPSNKKTTKKKIEKADEVLRQPVKSPRAIERKAMLSNTGKHATSAGVAHVLSKSRDEQTNTKIVNQPLPNVTFITNANPSQRKYDMDQAFDYYDNGLNENGDEYMDEFDYDDDYFGSMKEWELDNILSHFKK
nr:unnamed protein product [Naegleria fowleri]